ncbi:MAG: glycoside hydrolase family 5 protein [Mogibacterium sp.]|nr:glycoside hydrolase family 5 protein [Mogibacterium sp.]
MNRKYTLHIISALILSIALVLCGCGDGEYSDDQALEDTAQESAVQTEENSPADDGEAGTPFEAHGALSVKGTDLVDSNGDRFQLRGLSTHGLAWFPEYVNKETFECLRDDWNANCIRLAMYTDENGGYCSGGDQNQLKSKIREGVDAATELGMYVIIDWHVLSDQDPNKYKDQATAFFDEVSSEYGDRGNVIYEICNEPNGSATWESVTAYANEVIPVIRGNDPDCIVLVGSPTWSQDIDKAAAAPLSFDNVMYTLHFYAATHTDWLRDRMKECINNGLPVFVSEFGICDASGNGSVDIGQADRWKELIEKYNVSYICWNLSNKDESSAVIRSGCSKLSGWTEEELSEEGNWIRDWMRVDTQSE